MADEIEIAGQKLPWWSVPAAIGAGLGLWALMNHKPAAAPAVSGSGVLPSGGNAGTTPTGGGAGTAIGSTVSDPVQLAIISAAANMLNTSGQVASNFVNASAATDRTVYSTLAQGQAELFSAESASQRQLFASITQSQLALINSFKGAGGVNVAPVMDHPSVAVGGQPQVISPVVTQPTPVVNLTTTAALPAGVVQQQIVGPGYSITTNSSSGGSGGSSPVAYRYNDTITPLTDSGGGGGDSSNPAPSNGAFATSGGYSGGYYGE